jgi:hypothetical protein
MSDILLYYTSINLALKRFDGLTPKQLILLERLNRVGHPVTYGHLFRLLYSVGYAVQYRKYGMLLKASIEAGLITRTPIGRRVIFCITLKGKAVIEAFSAQVNKLVSSDLLQRAIIDQ